MKVNLIVAVSNNNVIGLNGKMPWNLSDDLKHFKKLTENHAVIMGRKTFESIGKSPDCVMAAALGALNVPVISNFFYSKTNVAEKEQVPKDQQTMVSYCGIT